MWGMGAAVERGEMPREEMEMHQHDACPSCGACQFMGSASTGQVLTEALGLALPGSGLIPAPLTRHLRVARAVGKQMLKLVEMDLTPRKILTREAFENAIMLHAAVGGSTNSLLHLPVIAREVGIEITIDDFDYIHRHVPVLANAKTTGKYPVEYLWYAGGVPAVMLQLRDLLHLDCLTVTGKTLGENLEEIERSRFFPETRGYLDNVKVPVEEVIRPRDQAFGPEGGVGVLRGNLAPGGAVIKHFSVPKEMHVHVGPARVFDNEDSAVAALIERVVQPGDVVVIRYEGPRANGMPEMYYATAIIAASIELDRHLRRRHRRALLRRGEGPGGRPRHARRRWTAARSHWCEEGDLIEINVPERRLAIVGTRDGALTPEEVDTLLADRRARDGRRPRPATRAASSPSTRRWPPARRMGHISRKGDRSSPTALVCWTKSEHLDLSMIRTCIRFPAKVGMRCKESTRRPRRAPPRAARSPRDSRTRSGPRCERAPRR